jgi:hypothetical protein
MIQILNLGSTIGVVKNGVLTGYNLAGIESVTWEKDGADYVVKITFLADNGCATETLSISLEDVSNIPSWTNDIVGSNQAVSDILSWIASSTSTPTPPELISWYALYQNGVAKTTSIDRPTTSGTILAGKNSASIANVGTANGTVKGVVLKPNETINFDAGAVNNTLDAIAYNATGTEFLIITVE